MKGPRRGVRLFVKTEANGPLVEVPIQVDPVDAEGHLKFYDNEDFRAEPVDRNDLMTFRVELFGKKLDPAVDQLPCRGSVVYELWDDATARHAYLTNCGDKLAPSFPSAVTFLAAENLLESSTYRYRFNSENYMQFSEIAFRDASGAFAPIAKNSKLMIRADVKNFFTMNFDSDEIISQMEARRLGSIGDLARLSFYLKILFFKIRMSLATDVGFFSDSGHIPMMVNLPVNAYDHLHPKSGILYTWELASSAATAPKTVTMPLLDPEEVAKGFENLAKVGARFCKGKDCSYRYLVEIGKQRLAMDLGIKKELVDRGFFPLYVDDVEKFRKAMGWDIEKGDGKGRVGMYFEVSGLPKGGHPWDFWMRLGSASESKKECPAWVRIGTVPKLTR